MSIIDMTTDAAQLAASLAKAQAEISLLTYKIQAKDLHLEETTKSHNSILESLTMKLIEARQQQIGGESFQINQLNTELNVSRELINTLRTQLDAAVATQKRDKKAYEDLVATQKRDKKAYDDLVATQKRDKKAYDDLVATQKRDKKAYQDLVAAQKRESKEYDELLAAQKRDKKAYEELLATQKRDKKAYEELLATQKRDKKAYEDLVATQKRDKKAYEDLVATQEREKKNHNDASLQIEQQNQLSSNEVDTLRKSLTAREKEIDQLETTNYILNRDIKDFQKQIQQLESALKTKDNTKNISSTHQKAIQTLQEEVNVQMNTIVQLESRLAEQTALVNANVEKDSTLVLSLRSEIQHLYDSQTQLTQEKDNALRNQAETMEKYRNNLKEATDGIRKEYSLLYEAHQHESKIQLRALQNQIMSLQQQLATKPQQSTEVVLPVQQPSAQQIHRASQQCDALNQYLRHASLFKKFKEFCEQNHVLWYTLESHILFFKHRGDDLVKRFMKSSYMKDATLFEEFGFTPTNVQTPSLPPPPPPSHTQSGFMPHNNDETHIPPLEKPKHKKIVVPSHSSTTTTTTTTPKTTSTRLSKASHVQETQNGNDNTSNNTHPSIKQSLPVNGYAHDHFDDWINNNISSSDDDHSTTTSSATATTSSSPSDPSIKRETPTSSDSKSRSSRERNKKRKAPPSPVKDEQHYPDQKRLDDTRPNKTPRHH